MDTNKKIVYIDMDNTLCDYQSAYDEVKRVSPEVEYPQSLKSFYLDLQPLPGAIDTYRWLDSQSMLDVYILTAPSIFNPDCYTDKRLWVERWLGMDVVDKLIVTSYKNLNKGDFLIDDMLSGKGQNDFEGELLHFGSDIFPNWEDIREYFQQSFS